MFQLKANQQEITALIQQRLLTLSVTDEAGMQADRLSVTLDDRDAAFEWPAQGAELTLWLQDSTNPTPEASSSMRLMGTYLVDEVAHSGPPARLTIEASAADMSASLKAPRTRSWDKIPLGDLIKSLAAEHQLMPRCETQLAQQIIEHLDQTQESDLHLLTRIAKERGAVVKPVQGYLVMVPKGEAKSVTGVALPKIQLEAKALLRYRFTQSERSQYQGVKVQWEDRESARVKTLEIGTGAPWFELRQRFEEALSARRAAEAQLKTLQRGTATLHLTLIGQPSLQAEGVIQLQGLRSPIEGEWLIERVEHRLDNQGFTTECAARLPNTAL